MHGKGVGAGDVHGAQGCGFYSHFHVGPAIVYLPASHEREVVNGLGPVESKTADIEFRGILACGPSNSVPLDDDLGTRDLFRG